MEKKRINSSGYKLEYRMGTRWNEKSYGWYLECKFCGEMTRVGGEEISSVTCSSCVNKQLSEYNSENQIKPETDD